MRILIVAMLAFGALVMSWLMAVVDASDIQNWTDHNVGTMMSVAMITLFAATSSLVTTFRK
jgi:hypothetical protein